MRVLGSMAVHEVTRATGDQAHSALRNLEIFGISFICYDADGRRGYSSRSASEFLASAPISDTVGHRIDRLVAQQLASRRRYLQLGRFMLAREISARPFPATIAIYLARPALEEIAAIAVIRPELPDASENAHLEMLSHQEQKVAQLISAGFSTKEIAHRLGISPHTARHHTEHVFTKLGVRSRAAVAALCAAG